MSERRVSGVRLGGLQQQAAVRGRCLLGGLLLALGSAGGCEIDCDERYCDFVRAAAGGIYAWEYQCCLEPQGPACEDRAIRYQTLAFGAPSMRMACEERNWDRVGEIWEEVRRVLPAVPLRIIVGHFCGFEVEIGENVATPFAAGDAVVMDVALAPAGAAGIPRMDRSHTGRGVDDSTFRSASGRSAWVVRRGSEVRIESRGASAGFEVTGILSVVESMVQGDEVDEWCRSLHPDELRLLLQGPDGTIRIDLDPTFRGNAVVFTEPDAGMIGVAVGISLDLQGPMRMAAPFTLEAAFLRFPFRIDPDGGLRLGSADPIDAFELWPLDPFVESFIAERETAMDSGGHRASCAETARVVADHFLRLHESECGGSGG